jgi:hypothetical protein
LWIVHISHSLVYSLQESTSRLASDHKARTTATAASLPPRLPLSTSSTTYSGDQNKHSNHYPFISREPVLRDNHHRSHEAHADMLYGPNRKAPLWFLRRVNCPNFRTATHVVFAIYGTILHAAAFIDVNTDAFLRPASSRGAVEMQL